MQRRRQGELQANLKQARLEVSERLPRGNLRAILNGRAQIDAQRVNKIRRRVEHERDTREIRQDVGKHHRAAPAQLVKIATPACLACKVAGQNSLIRAIRVALPRNFASKTSWGRYLDELRR